MMQMPSQQSRLDPPRPPTHLPLPMQADDLLQPLPLWRGLDALHRPAEQAAAQPGQRHTQRSHQG